MSAHWSEVRWADVSNHTTGPHEAGLLKLNCDKALSYLRWTAAMNFEQTVKMTTDWYRSFYEDPLRIRALTETQIQHYTTIAQQGHIEWAQ